jgi:hypothetical protein
LIRKALLQIKTGWNDELCWKITGVQWQANLNKTIVEYYYQSRPGGHSITGGRIEELKDMGYELRC